MKFLNVNLKPYGSECSKIRTHILKKGRDSIIDFISKTGERIVVVNPSAPPNY